MILKGHVSSGLQSEKQFVSHQTPKYRRTTCQLLRRALPAVALGLMLSWHCTNFAQFLYKRTKSMLGKKGHGHFFFMIQTLHYNKGKGDIFVYQAVKVITGDMLRSLSSRRLC